MNVIARTPIRVRHELKRRLLQVVSVEDLTPHLRRIVVGGEDLLGFTSAGFDDHVKLFFPAPGAGRPAFPEGPGAAGPPPAMRDYTPRRYDPVRNELTLEFVLHEHGPASDWARQAEPGQWLGVGGPRGSMVIPESYGTWLLAGDETALPAIARRLEEMPAGSVAHVLIDVADADDQRHLATAAHAAITWLPRNGAPAGNPDRLVAALRALDLPAGDTNAWIAAEIETARALRRVLIEEKGFDRADIRAAGYWRLGAVAAHERVED